MTAYLTLLALVAVPFALAAIGTDPYLFPDPDERDGEATTTPDERGTRPLPAD